VECHRLMQSFYFQPLPTPNLDTSEIVCILDDHRLFLYICPRDERLNHDYFYTLLSCLSSNHIVRVFQAILLSKRLLVLSQSLSKLTKCCLAFSLLIYPFVWPYSLVSLMPSSWLPDLIDSPCPFIYGCLSKLKHDRSITIDDNDTIEIDLDLNTIENHLDTRQELPLNLRQILESSLTYLTKFRWNKADPILMNIAASEACLHVFTELFHCLPDYFKREDNMVTSSLDELDRRFSICSDYFQFNSRTIESQSIVSVDQTKSIMNEHVQRDHHRFNYDFRHDEFLSQHVDTSYVSFLNDFLRGSSLNALSYN
jgi:hypothetical protein